VRILSVGILSGALCLAAADSAAPAPRLTPPAAPALSIGSPNGGRLDGGARLSETPYMRVVPYYAESNARWGLPSLVGLIDRAARRVTRKFPDAVLSVGDLSRRGGGELDRHRSHESGRDADIGFYISNGKRPILPLRFVAFSATGSAPAMPGAIFDDARNWGLIEALVDDSFARVSHIFVAAHIRARLLRYAEQMGVSSALRQRVAEVMMQPRRAVHDDHFHIRVACPREQHRTCVEEAILPASHMRPPVARSRQRSGTDDRRRPFPALPLPPKGSGAIATFGGRAEALGIGDTTETTTSLNGPRAELSHPLANAPEADNVEP
jgi:penicillin-insensitive murein endopeptidase